jgi:membrane protease YdiL (CAAX protease family)
MKLNSNNLARKRIAFGLAWIAIILRMASDWIFPGGGPLYYQLIQAFFLLLAIAFLWHELEVIFLKGGNVKSSIHRGLWAIPFAIIGGLLLAYAKFGGPQLPTLAGALALIANNLFFPVVEELEFRGFFLSWLLEKRITPVYAIWLAAVVHLIAHIHLFLQGNYLMAVVTLLVFVWYGSITVKTKSLWGAMIAHSSVDIFGFLPSAGSGTDIMRTGN